MNSRIRISKTIFLVIVISLSVGGLSYYLFSPLDQPVSAQALSSEGEPRATRMMKIIQLLDERIGKSTSEEARKANQNRREYFARQATELAQPTTDTAILMGAKLTAIAEATQSAKHLANAPEPTREVGLFSGVGYVKGVSNEAKLSQNYFIGKLEDGYITVLAGNLKADPSQGVIYIYYSQYNRREKFLLPEKTGMIRIDSGDEGSLRIADEMGKTYSFDLSIKSFETSEAISSPSPTLVSTPSEGSGTPYPIP